MSEVREIKAERRELRQLKKIKPDFRGNKKGLGHKRNNVSTGPANPFTNESQSKSYFNY